LGRRLGQRQSLCYPSFSSESCLVNLPFGQCFKSEDSYVMAVSLGDVYLILKKGTEAIEALKDAPEEYRDLQTEVRIVNRSYDKLQDLWLRAVAHDANPHLRAIDSDIGRLCMDFQPVWADVNQIVVEYQELSRNTRKRDIFKRGQFAFKNLTPTYTRLRRHRDAAESLLSRLNTVVSLDTNDVVHNNNDVVHAVYGRQAVLQRDIRTGNFGLKHIQKQGSVAGHKLDELQAAQVQISKQLNELIRSSVKSPEHRRTILSLDHQRQAEALVDEIERKTVIAGVTFEDASAAKPLIRTGLKNAAMRAQMFDSVQEHAQSPDLRRAVLSATPHSQQFDAVIQEVTRASVHAGVTVDVAQSSRPDIEKALISSSNEMELHEVIRNVLQQHTQPEKEVQVSEGDLDPSLVFDVHSQALQAGVHDDYLTEHQHELKTLICSLANEPNLSKVDPCSDDFVGDSISQVMEKMSLEDNRESFYSAQERQTREPSPLPPHDAPGSSYRSPRAETEASAPPYSTRFSDPGRQGPFHVTPQKPTIVNSLRGYPTPPSSDAPHMQRPILNTGWSGQPPTLPHRNFSDPTTSSTTPTPMDKPSEPSSSPQDFRSSHLKQQNSDLIHGMMAHGPFTNQSTVSVNWGDQEAVMNDPRVYSSTSLPDPYAAVPWSDKPHGYDGPPMTPWQSRGAGIQAQMPPMHSGYHQAPISPRSQTHQQRSVSGMTAYNGYATNTQLSNPQMGVPNAPLPSAPDLLLQLSPQATHRSASPHMGSTPTQQPPPNPSQDDLQQDEEDLGMAEAVRDFLPAGQIYCKFRQGDLIQILEYYNKDWLIGRNTMTNDEGRLPEKAIRWLDEEMSDKQEDEPDDDFDDDQLDDEYSGGMPEQDTGLDSSDNPFDEMDGHKVLFIDDLNEGMHHRIPCTVSEANISCSPISGSSMQPRINPG
jgi:hypothetical protein